MAILHFLQSKGRELSALSQNHARCNLGRQYKQSLFRFSMKSVCESTQSGRKNHSSLHHQKVLHNQQLHRNVEGDSVWLFAGNENSETPWKCICDQKVSLHKSLPEGPVSIVVDPLCIHPNLRVFLKTGKIS